MKAELMPVQFYGDTVFLVEHNEEPYVPARPIVDNIGLKWSSQHRKLQSNDKRWGVLMMRTPSLGGTQEMVCMPLRKLPAFLFSIDARKVKPELRSKIEMYQEECDKALWDYWTKGVAINPRSYQSEDGKLPWPGLSMDAIATLCKQADKGGRTSLRALGYFTGMPVDDLLEEFATCVMPDTAIRRFVDTCLMINPDAREKKRDVYDRYLAFCQAQSCEPFNYTHFGRALHGYIPGLRTGRESTGERVNVYKGIQLTSGYAQ